MGLRFFARLPFRLVARKLFCCCMLFHGGPVKPFRIGMYAYRTNEPCSAIFAGDRKPQAGSEVSSFWQQSFIEVACLVCRFDGVVVLNNGMMVVQLPNSLSGFADQVVQGLDRMMWLLLCQLQKCSVCPYDPHVGCVFDNESERSCLETCLQLAPGKVAPAYSGGIPPSFDGAKVRGRSG